MTITTLQKDVTPTAPLWRSSILARRGAANYLVTGHASCCLTELEWEFLNNASESTLRDLVGTHDAIFIGCSLAAAMKGLPWEAMRDSIKRIHKWFLKNAAYKPRRAIDLVKNLFQWAMFSAFQSDQRPRRFAEQLYSNQETGQPDFESILPELVPLGREVLAQFGLAKRALPEGNLEMVIEALRAFCTRLEVSRAVSSSLCDAVVLACSGLEPRCLAWGQVWATERLTLVPE